MFIIDKTGKIKLTKGDSASFVIEIYDLDCKPYEIKSTDTLTFTVRKTVNSSTATLTKTANSEHYFIISHDDTANLPSGLYVYDVQLVSQEGNVYTVCPTNYFQLTSEVSR